MIKTERKRLTYESEVIDQRCISVNDLDGRKLELKYVLHAIKLPERVYVISVCSSSDFAAECLGRDKNKAVYIFDAISRNEVTPISLSDILRDMLI